MLKNNPTSIVSTYVVLIELWDVNFFDFLAFLE